MIPLRNTVLCKPIEVEEHYPGSPILLLQDRLEAETAQQAEVVAVGPGRVDEDGDFVPTDPALKPGTWILHEPFRRVALNEDGTLFILHDTDVVAILG
jgi:co-chaperonin GroES (HSP10)